MIVLFWILAALSVTAGLLLLAIMAHSEAEARREDVPEEETEPRERRGAWSRMMCRNQRRNRLGRWVQINRVLR